MEPSSPASNQPPRSAAADSGQAPRPRSGQPSRRPPFRRPGPNQGPRPAGSANRGPRRSSRPPRRSSDNDLRPQPVKKIPEIDPGTIRIIPLGGVEEVGRNMTVVEMGPDIIIVDIGLQIPGDEVPGVDYIIPDITYLETRKHKIRGIVITHGHLDHIGGIPYIVDKIGNPPIYASLLTAVMIKKRQSEFPHLPPLDIQVVEKNDNVRLGALTVRFFTATHTIPDSMGAIIGTPFGNLIFTGDIKIDHTDGNPEPAEVETFSKIAKEKTLLLVADSTNVEKPGFSYSERQVQENLRDIIKNVPGRLIVGTFASLLERIVFIIKIAEELGKKIAVEGRSMKDNVEIAKELGIIKMKKDTMVASENLNDYPDNKLVILATGAQGDEFGALMRISRKDHRLVKLKKGDTVLLSSSVIPGNERVVQKLKDNLARLGADIVHQGVANVHSSGHSYRGEVEWVNRMIKPVFLIPVHGHHQMLRVHAKVAMALGMPEKNIVVPDNGSVIEITDEGTKIAARKESASARVVMVDGLGSNDVKEVVIRDRKLLAEDGMFVIVALVDGRTGQVRKSPDIISRGFVYLKEAQELLRYVRILTKRTIEDSAGQMHPINYDYLRNLIREEVGKYLFQKTHNRPIILPVLIEV